MTWKPKTQPTSAEVAKAKSLLPPNPAWKIGVIVEEGVIQYRGAMHPNASGEGTHPGVEVWTNVGAEPVKEDLGTSSPEEIELVLQAAEAQGYPRDEVYSVVQIESAWKPHNYYHSPKVPPEKAAGGLIGFMPFVLKALGWTGTAIEFRAQTTAQQAPWVGKYFAQVKNQWRYPGDTYVAVAAGGYVGRPDSTPVYKSGTQAYDLNKVWDTDKDGVITVGDLRKVLLTRMKKAPAGGTANALPKDQAEPERFFLDLSPVLSSRSVCGIKRGDKNSSAVRAVQIGLKDEGLYKGKIDGAYGPLTSAAIKEFLR